MQIFGKSNIYLHSQSQKKGASFADFRRYNCICAQRIGKSNIFKKSAVIKKEIKKRILATSHKKKNVDF